ncbi:hypothetical protein HPB51_022964 [Rhipicephalus microplus]|uniref:Uncharacterized protein n=1 Tax=Rhipicephalus microplus TaxID=6941 RepID=A0A9J6DCN0_RHIMP|nr:hypothetical protein HPB51_022964 [Rhipicephalus microplus]
MSIILFPWSTEFSSGACHSVLLLFYRYFLDYGLGKFEVTFTNDEASRWFSDDPVLAIRDARIRFQYRGVRVKVVRVIGFPADADVRIIVQLLAMYGKVLDVAREESAYLPGVWSGVLVVKMEMHKSVPNLHEVRDVIVQFEYEGVARVCRRCYRTGHHAAKCTVPQCVRCGAFGHDQCAVKCKHCGGDHGPSQSKARTNSSAAPPVASSSSQEQVSGVAEDREAAPGDAEGSTQPEPEPISERAPGGEEQEAGSELAEALTLSAAAEPSPASHAGAPGTSPADAPAAEEKEEPMSWTDAVRGKKRRANRSPGPSKERLAAAPSGGPGSPKDDLLVPKRAAATESDEESTSSTVTGSTTGTPKFRDRNGDLELRELVQELGLVDAWRSLRLLQSGMTWTGSGSRSRIDRFYVSPSLAPSMHSSWLCSSALSDHSLIALRFADSSLVPWGKRPWRLNPRLFKDKDATKDVATYLIGSLLGDQNLGGSDWDTVKAGVAERFRDWGKRRAREERAGIKVVSDAILLLSKPLSCGPAVTAALTSLRKEYRVLLQRRWDRLRATARAEQWEMEAWCSRNVLRRHLARKSSKITSLVNPNTGSLVETQDEVLEVARQFYKNLYAEPPPTPYSFPFTKTYEDFDICDTPLVEEEVFAVLKSMNHNRSPGAASTLARLQEVDPEIDLVSIELRELVDRLAPELPERYREHDLSQHSPNWR